MLPILPAPGSVADGDDSPAPLHPEVANDVSTDVPKSGPQACAPVPKEPVSFEPVYALAKSHLPRSLRHWGVPEKDVADVVQDVAMIVRDRLPDFTPRGEPTPDLERSLRAWILAIGWRVAARLRGRGHRRFEVPKGDPSDLGAADGSLNSEEIVAANQRRAILAGVVRTLRPERAVVLLMHVVLGMTVPEIAEALDLNANTVKSRLGRARADALAAIEQLSPEEQGVLKGGLLVLPLLYAIDIWGTAPASPAPGGDDARRERAAPRSRFLRGASLVAGAVAMLAIGMAIGVGLRGPARHAADEVPVVAAVDRAEPEETSTERAVSTPAQVPAQLPRDSRSAGTDARSQSLVREQRLLAMAQRALLNRDAEQMQAALSAHAAEFPHGALASQREVLREHLRALADEH